jgi:hypothetical protein
MMRPQIEVLRQDVADIKAVKVNRILTFVTLGPVFGVLFDGFAYGMLRSSSGPSSE